MTPHPPLLLINYVEIGPEQPVLIHLQWSSTVKASEHVCAPISLFVITMSVCGIPNAEPSNTIRVQHSLYVTRCDVFVSFMQQLSVPQKVSFQLYLMIKQLADEHFDKAQHSENC